MELILARYESNIGAFKQQWALQFPTVIRRVRNPHPHPKEQLGSWAVRLLLQHDQVLARGHEESCLRLSSTILD
jgi:hypothetical protein